MFRGESNIDLEQKYFSVGSTISLFDEGEFLIIGEGNTINLLSLVTFQVTTVWIAVEDCNFISEQEIRNLLGSYQNMSAFSDYEFHPLGLKK